MYEGLKSSRIQEATISHVQIQWFQMKMIEIIRTYTNMQTFSQKNYRNKR
jgi:hypothetical protein